MNHILYSNLNNIEFDDKNVKINGENVSQDIIETITDTESSNTNKIYAYRRMREYYQVLLSKQFENLVVLSGSGTSVNVGIPEKTGLTMREMWRSVVDEIGIDELGKFAKLVKYDDLDNENTDLEALLSKAILAMKFINSSFVNGIIARIESIIRDKCSLKLPENAPHEIFLKKATSRKLKYSRLKIFTLNYDLLFEQAASKNGYLVIDGFSFSYPRRFNGVNFDYDIVLRNNSRFVNEENYASRVFHLYKPHGSLDWERKDNLIIKANGESEQPLMIYPSSSKFEASFEQPYFEMMARFQQELRKQNTFLIVVGFSFYDKHIRAMIYEALDVNPSITLLVVSPGVSQNESFSDLRERATLSPNIILVNETFENFSKFYPTSDIYDFSPTEGDFHE